MVILLLASFCGAQFCVPPSWHLKASCQAIGSKLRGREEYGSPETGVSWLGGLAKTLLPAASETENYQDLETPFLEQEVKRLLRQCVFEFRRIVILIDDVDALPSEEFPNFLRLLRPVGKISGVTCVVVVPYHFYHQFRWGKPNDIHAVAQSVYVLGDRQLFEARPGMDGADWFALKPSIADLRLQERIRSLLIAQLRIPIAGKDAPSFLFKISKRWRVTTQVRRALEHFGPSRRELLRESIRLLNGEAKGPFEHFPGTPEALQAEQKRAMLERSNCCASEQSLLCSGDVCATPEE